MADERIRAWADELVACAVRRFERARRRFVRNATDDHLHDVRTAARRLHSLLEDLADVVTLEQRKRLHKIVEASAVARDAAVLRVRLRRVLDEHERNDARPLLRRF